MVTQNFRKDTHALTQTLGGGLTHHRVHVALFFFFNFKETVGLFGEVTRSLHRQILGTLPYFMGWAHLLPNENYLSVGRIGMYQDRKKNHG